MTDGFRPLLPSSVAVREQRGALDDEAWRTLPEPERSAAEGIVLRRRAEFATGRLLAREALAALGIERVVIPRRGDRAPAWPVDVTGAITHCDGLVAAAVARRAAWRAIGIDAEVADRVDAEIVEHIASTDERERLAAAESSLPLGAVLFAAKECVQKAFGPALEAILPFAAVELLAVVPDEIGRVEFAVREARLREAARTEQLTLAWRLDGPLVLVALAVAAD